MREGTTSMTELTEERPAGPAPTIIQVALTVYGTPAPQGSKRAFAVRGKGGVPTGRVAVIESSHDRVKSWRQAVIDEAVKATSHMAAPVSAGGLGLDGPLDGPLSLRMIFYLARPKGHYGTGRNAGHLRDSAPWYPSGTPDLSKLARSTEDALSDAGIWTDDARVVRYTELAKYWCGQSFIRPGAYIEVTPMRLNLALR